MKREKKHALLDEAALFVNEVPRDTLNKAFVALVGIFTVHISALETQEAQKYARESLAFVLAAFPMEVIENIVEMLNKEVDENDR